VNLFIGLPQAEEKTFGINLLEEASQISPYNPAPRHLDRCGETIAPGRNTVRRTTGWLTCVSRWRILAAPLN
jgi:hypothetical protein